MKIEFRRLKIDGFEEFPGLGLRCFCLLTSSVVALTQ